MSRLHATPRLHATKGIAIGPILFVLALLAVLGGVLQLTMGGGMGGAVTQDSVTTTLRSQADLVRAKIMECNLITGIPNTTFVALEDGTACTSGAPCLVEDLSCLNDAPVSGDYPNLWVHASRPANLPPPPSGFAKWYYAQSGTTRCIYIQPSSTPSQAVRQGILGAQARFSAQEAKYTDSTPWRFIISITGGVSSTPCD